MFGGRRRVQLGDEQADHHRISVQACLHSTRRRRRGLFARRRLPDPQHDSEESARVRDGSRLLGPSFSNEECANALRESGLRFEASPDEDLLPRVARMIADGAVVGWFQGRMEFGPRALGNRSFLADPRRADMRELLNKKVKLREWFRPAAPSMLEESSAEIFGVHRRDPFMVTVFTVAEGQRERIPAVVHVDNTARPQTVSRAANPRYWNLIKSSSG